MEHSHLRRGGGESVIGKGKVDKSIRWASHNGGRRSVWLCEDGSEKRRGLTYLRNEAAVLGSFKAPVRGEDKSLAKSIRSSTCFRQKGPGEGVLGTDGCKKRFFSRKGVESGSWFEATSMYYLWGGKSKVCGERSRSGMCGEKKNE